MNCLCRIGTTSSRSNTFDLFRCANISNESEFAFIHCDRKVVSKAGMRDKMHAFHQEMIGTRLAHYEITSHLGSGGMGEVYQATDSKLGRSVAIKLLPDAF